MATYDQPCVHCGALTFRDGRLCERCGAPNPFGFQCPDCLRGITREQKMCVGCGRSLVIACPACAAPTFVDSRCDACGASLMVRCANKRCGEAQFFTRATCTACGKKIKQSKAARSAARAQGATP